MKDFTEELLGAAQSSILSLIEKGDWLKIDYQSRATISQQDLNSVFADLDFDRIRVLVREKLEEKIADKIIHAMATEVSNDVKSVVTNAPLRENLRLMIRDAIKDASKGLTES